MWQRAWQRVRGRGCGSLVGSLGDPGPVPNVLLRAIPNISDRALVSDARLHFTDYIFDGYPV